MTDRALWGQTAIVGIGETDYGALYRGSPRSREDYAIEAIGTALADASLTKDQIDGLIVSGMASYEPVMFRAGLENVRFLAHYPHGRPTMPACPRPRSHGRAPPDGRVRGAFQRRRLSVRRKSLRWRHRRESPGPAPSHRVWTDSTTAPMAWRHPEPSTPCCSPATWRCRGTRGGPRRRCTRDPYVGSA